ncbi:helix-turn-helix domain-containing protein [Rothia sp. SD9660Na]|uniref:helix-turn-helix domain-containing protein n=1 Tax=Rothia sp. SD9660Na TaxID=3047030 RepID=UPI0024BB0D7F|nr:helix-turn-helix domain-containing protein [Rothia sp. SD9660Na]WHS49724.1 helix-turn-helix domain-containing protein [Rothia sp. SD9660Na]
MVEQRFLTLTDVGEILNISPSQTRALVRSGELKAIQIGGRNQWRVEKSMLEAYISERYAMTEEAIRAEQAERADVS